MYGYKQENYVGQYNDRNQKHGTGELKCPEFVYDGDWFENRREGKGVCYYSSTGKCYKGEWKKDMYHGKGLLIGEDLTSYEGEFINGKKNGKGTLKMPDGSTHYDGKWEDDQFEGQGVLTISRLNYRYDGQFHHGKKSGQGTESFANGNQYTGSFVNDYKHGPGTFSSNSGYNYNGEWQFGVRQGYGVEYNTPSEDSEPEGRYKEAFLYEGEFWNGLRNGIGKLMNMVGDYYYGGFANDKKDGIGFFFNNNEKIGKLYQYVDGDMDDPEEIPFDFGLTIPRYIKGYHEDLARMYDKKMNYLEEYFPDRKLDSYYFFRTENLRKLGDIMVRDPRFLNIEDMSIKVTFSHEIDTRGQQRGILSSPIAKNNTSIYNNPKVMVGKVFNNQLIPFLIDLVRKKEHLRYVINMYSSSKYKFYCFWMYFTRHDILQKYPLAVNDVVPISLDGLNLYTQLEDSKNIVLSMLEKVWSKYVYIHKMEDRLFGRYIDRIMLAYLGAPCKKIWIHKEYEKNNIEYLMEIVNRRIPANVDYLSFKNKLEGDLGKIADEEGGINLDYLDAGKSVALKKEILKQKTMDKIMNSYSPYAYAYPRRECGMQGQKYDDLFIIKEIIQTIPDGPVAVIIEAIHKQINYIGTINDTYIDALRVDPRFEYYFEEREDNYHYALNFKDFIRIFEVIFYSNYSTDKKYNYHTYCKDKSNSTAKFVENCFSFEAYMNDNITISVMQDHILKKESLKRIKGKLESLDYGREAGDRDANGKNKTMESYFNLPIRLILGRKSLKKERMKMFPGMFKGAEKQQMMFIHNIKNIQAEKEKDLAEKIKKKNKKVGFRKGDQRRQIIIGNDSRNATRTPAVAGRFGFPELTISRPGQTMDRLEKDNNDDSPSNNSELGNESNEDGTVDSISDKAINLDYSNKLDAKRDPFDSTIKGLKLSRSDIKYVGGKGQSQETTIDLENMKIEQGKHVLMVQLENDMNILKRIKKLRFHITIQNSLGTMNMTHVIKPPNFMEKIYTDAAIRLGEQSALTGQTSQHKGLYTFQYFSKDDSIYSQVFINKNHDKIWNQKLNFNLKNMRILGIKDHRKPITMRIKPKKQRVLVIQQVGCKSFNLIGGEGACFTEQINKFNK